MSKLAKFHGPDLTIPLALPDVTEREINSVLEVLRTPYLSLGPKLIEFEHRFANYVGARYAVAVNSGTAGLHLAIKSLGIGERDAVITTPFSFVASANCILFERATPVFVDVEESTFNIDPDKIAEYITNHCIRTGSGKIIDRGTGKEIKAILPVHVFGHPCRMDRIMEIADRHNLFVVEDACEAIGALFGERKVGTIGNAGVFAFYPNKQITTGEGGMIVTNSPKIAEICKSLRNQGRDGKSAWLNHSRIGYNYRLSDINCALGLAQLERLPEILRKRARVAAEYNIRLKDYVNIPTTQAGVEKSWFTYVICLPEKYTQTMRDEILQQLCRKGIGCNNYFPPIHLQPVYRRMFGYQRGDFPVTESISERTIALSFHNNLQDHEIDYVVDCLTNILHDYTDRIFEETSDFEPGLLNAA